MNLCKRNHFHTSCYTQLCPEDLSLHQAAVYDWFCFLAALSGLSITGFCLPPVSAIVKRFVPHPPTHLPSGFGLSVQPAVWQRGGPLLVLYSLHFNHSAYSKSLSQNSCCSKDPQQNLAFQITILFL